MFFNLIMFDNKNYFLSWKKASLNVFRLQRRIIKSVCVGDFLTSLRLQKLLVLSNSARLLSIRFVTQSLKFTKAFDSYDRFNLTSVERFKLNNLLLKNINNWRPVKFKSVIISDSSLVSPFKIQMWSIPDRCWSYLINLAVKPAHEVFFSPTNFTFCGLPCVHRIQKFVFLNLIRQSYGLQKRVLIVYSLDDVQLTNFRFLLKKLLVPRSIKMGIFRFLKLGLEVNLSNNSQRYNHLGFLLANVLFSDFDFLLRSVRVGSNLIVFIKPNENELEVSNKFLNFLYSVNIDGV